MSKRKATPAQLAARAAFTAKYGGKRTKAKHTRQRHRNLSPGSRLSAFDKAEMRSLGLDPSNPHDLRVWMRRRAQMLHDFSEDTTATRGGTHRPKTKSRNPKRPPKKFMRRCVAKVAKRGVRSPGAVCASAWRGKMSRKAKTPWLRKENTTPIGSRVHLKVADPRYKDGRPLPGVWTVTGRQGGRLLARHPSGTVVRVAPHLAVRANPEHAAVAKAREESKAFHWGVTPKRTLPVRVHQPRGPYWSIGDVEALAYRTKKGNQRATWEHMMGEGGGKRPKLLVDAKRRLIIHGGTYDVRPEGIVK